MLINDEYKQNESESSDESQCSSKHSRDDRKIKTKRKNNDEIALDLVTVENAKDDDNDNYVKTSPDKHQLQSKSFSIPSFASVPSQLLRSDTGEPSIGTSFPDPVAKNIIKDLSSDSKQDRYNQKIAANTKSKSQCEEINTTSNDIAEGIGSCSPITGARLDKRAVATVPNQHSELDIQSMTEREQEKINRHPRAKKKIMYVAEGTKSQKHNISGSWTHARQKHKEAIPTIVTNSTGTSTGLLPDGISIGDLERATRTQMKHGDEKVLFDHRMTQEKTPLSVPPENSGENRLHFKDSDQDSVVARLNSRPPSSILNNDKSLGSRPGAFPINGINTGPSHAWDSCYGLNVEDIHSNTDENCSHIPSIPEEEEEIDHLSVVDDEMLHQTFRQVVMSEVAEATVVEMAEHVMDKYCYFLWSFTVLVVLGTVIGVSVIVTKGDSSTTTNIPSIIPTVAPTSIIVPTLSPTHNTLPTLEIIQNNGVVRCGIGWTPVLELEIDMCRALAAAVLGNPDKIDAVHISWGERWEALERNRTLDVITMASTFTMARDVYQKDAETGFTFSTPYLYEGVYFAGIPEYVECADRLDTYFGNCRGVRMCVSEGGTIEGIIRDYVADSNIISVPFDTVKDMFVNGFCNVFVSNTLSHLQSVFQEEAYFGKYSFGETNLFSDPLCLVTRQDDPEWSDFVTWIVRALIAAEEQNITNTTASNFLTTTLFGETYKNMFVNAIKAVGNYGDLFQKHVESIVSRDTLKMNLLNNGSTGLHYKPPLGAPSSSNPEPRRGSTIHAITKEQGEVRCGIYERVGFAKEVADNKAPERGWHGMDTDYCYALSASLFHGDVSKVKFVLLADAEDGFKALDSGKVDVITGGRVTLESDVKEETTGKGFTFSVPYFYGVQNTTVSQDNLHLIIPEGAVALVTREDDPQWSDFVNWVVIGTFIAEEQLITQAASEDMVDVSVFGPSFQDMYRHAILAVGNYAEIYDRNLKKLIPRLGRNLLNTNPFGPQLFSFF